ncbi:hypothetical protein B0I35DRAFT_180658 [Stachybotrys elegans]|uniref:Uncharacterized protein n=1 Tax=Stachybotrys elegans TaxID=80388 RepID=A0A8K0WIM2_9HYPO|nr:hypothetical protein B0I35DRAFT_180658 [Stachybotrys elegans]
MVVEIGASTPEAVQLLQLWRRHRHGRGDGKPLLAESDMPRFAPSTPALESFLIQRLPASMLDRKTTTTTRSARALPAAASSGGPSSSSSSLPSPPSLIQGRCASSPAKPDGPEPQTRTATPSTSSSSSTGGFVFGVDAAAASLGHLELGLQLTDGHPRVWQGGVKRYRHGLDVDGPNTAGLSCKKRRLRAELITSRLSQPFSQPATHILNREGMKSGDKRFLKIATTIDLARRIAHLHATSLLRFSLMNSLRKRLGVARNTGAAGMDMTNRGAWQPQDLQTSSGGKYIRPSVAPDAAAAAAAAAASASRVPAQSRPAPVKLAPVVARMPVCRLSKPAALPRPSGEEAATSRTSPRIHPVRSPELRPLQTALDDIDEDSFAFLHPDDDGWCETGDEPEHVYSDFGVIFGGGAEATGTEEHSYEEYLDNLDGITWVH